MLEHVKISETAREGVIWSSRLHSGALKAQLGELEANLSPNQEITNTRLAGDGTGARHWLPSLHSSEPREPR